MSSSVVEVTETTALVETLETTVLAGEVDVTSTQVDIQTVVQAPSIIEVGIPGVQGPPGDNAITSIPFVFGPSEPGGHIVVETGMRRFYNPTDRTLAIRQIVAAASDAPGSQAIIWDVKINGVSIWALTPANRVKILPGQNSGVQTVFDTAVLGPTDYFTADVLQVGAPGAEGSGTSLIIGTEG